MYNLEHVIKGLVCTPVHRRSLNTKYKQVINNHIKYLQNKRKGNDFVVWEIISLIDDGKFYDNYDSERSSFSTYTMTCLYYKILKNYEKKLRKCSNKDKDLLKYGQQFFENGSDKIDTFTVNERTSEDCVSNKELLALVKKELNPVVYSMLLEGYTNIEIGKKIGKSAQYVANYLCRKRRKLNGSYR